MVADGPACQPRVKSSEKRGALADIPTEPRINSIAPPMPEVPPRRALGRLRNGQPECSENLGPHSNGRAGKPPLAIGCLRDPWQVRPIPLIKRRDRLTAHVHWCAPQKFAVVQIFYVSWDPCWRHAAVDCRLGGCPAVVVMGRRTVHKGGKGASSRLSRTIRVSSACCVYVG